MFSDKVFSRPASASGRLMKESDIVRRRNAQHKFYEYWNHVTKDFQKANLSSAIFNDWSSPDYYNTRENAHTNAAIVEEKNKKLLQRKMKLAELLAEESREQDITFIELSQSSQNKRDKYSLQELHILHKNLKERHEDHIKKERELKLHLHWKLNDPSVREFRSKRDCKDLLEIWNKQLKEKEEIKKQEEKDMELWLAEREKQLLQEELKYKTQQEERKSREMCLLKDLQRQREELREKDRFMQDLTNLEFQTEQIQAELDKLLVREEDLERKFRNIKTKQILQHQCKIQIQKRTKEVQEELAETLKMLDKLLVDEMENREKVAASKQQCWEEMESYKKLLYKQAETEKIREKEMQFIFSEDAERMYKKLEEQWNTERNARAALFKDVLESRREQIEKKLANIALEKEQIRRSKEDILRKIETVLEDIEKEKREVKETQEKTKKLLDIQVSLHKNDELEKLRLERLKIEEEKIKTKEESERLLSEFHNIEKGLCKAYDFRRRRVKW